jgi:hypothetical protein
MTRQQAMWEAAELAALADMMARQMGARFVVCPAKREIYVRYRTGEHWRDA